MRTMPTKIQRQQRAEDGIVAILVVIVFTALLALIALSFSHLMNREARQALDRQLSLQSYYSAESGLNDAKAYLHANPNAPNSTGCAAPTASPNPFVQNGDISGNAVAKYSCVIINPSPNELTFDLAPGESKVFKLDINALSNVYFSWQNKQYAGVPQPLGTFKSLPREDQLSSPDATGILRTALYQVARGSGVLANANAVLTSGTLNYFMYPDAGAGTVGTVGSAATDNGAFVHGYCNANTHPALPYGSSNPKFCNSKVTGLDGANNTYYVRIMAVYAPLSVSIQTSDKNDKTQGIPNVEGVVDITGAGNDVISRIQARVVIGNQPYYPSYGIQSMQAVCKLFRIPARTATSSDQPELQAGAPNNDGACEVPTNLGALGGSGIPPFDDVPCGTNATGSFPNCQCPPGWSGNPTISCTPPPPCGTNALGSYPNCTCPSGWTGDPNVACYPPPPPPPSVSCGPVAASNNGSQAWGSGGCTDGSGSWTYSYSDVSACGNYSGGGGGSFFDSFGAEGSWTVSFTITGTGGASASGSTSWRQSFGFC